MMCFSLFVLMTWHNFIEQTAGLRHLTPQTAHRCVVSPLRRQLVVSVGPKDRDGGHIDHGRLVEQSHAL